MFDGRWWYWTRTIEKGRPLDEPIPRIDFDSFPNPETAKTIKDCIRFMNAKGHGSRESWNAFIEWILWGLGAAVQSEFPTRVTEEISWYWYKTFNLGLMMKFPCDYMAWGSCEIAGMAHKGNGNGYFPTPQHVVKMMVQMTMTEADKTKKVCDPCLGTGVMVLEASNYSLRLYGQEISLEMVKMATVNAFLYIPWLAHPATGLIDWNTAKDYEDALQKIEGWKRSNQQILQLDYKPKSNRLDCWI